MAAQSGLSHPALVRGGVSVFPPVPLSAEAAPFTPMEPSGWGPGSQSEAEKLFSNCAIKLRALRADSVQLKEELNLLFDQLLSENYNRTFEPADVCSLLKHASCLVPLTQEHLVIKLCQVVHHLLNQLKVIMYEHTLDVLVNYTAGALKVCSTWTHTDVLLALSTVVYGNGPQCHQHLSDLLGEEGFLLQYSSPSQSNMELRRVALTCMANICLRIPGQPPLDDQYRSVCFQAFLKTLQSTKPPDTDELFYCMVIQAALKGLQCCLSGGKWKFGGGEELGSVLAALKRLMFQGAPGVIVEWPAVLYPAPLPQYESLSASKKRKSKGKGKKTKTEESRGDEREEGDAETVPALLKGRAEEKQPASFLYPSWKLNSSDSEFSDLEGNAQSKLRVNHGRVRQGALHCLLVVVKAVEKRTLYGYWSSFIPDSPIGGSPPLTLVTIILKDLSPKVRLCALQVLSAMLDSSRQFLAVAEDTASPRTSYTPFSFTLATAIRELHRTLSLALLAETSPQTLTQVIKCLAYLVANAPYHRLRPGLLTQLWKQIRPYVRHRDVNVRVSVLTLYGALVTTQAPLPEVQLLLQQPDHSSSMGVFTPQDSGLSWRQRDGVSSPSRTPVKHSQRSSSTHSPHIPHTPGEEDSRRLWLLQLCVTLVTQPREDQSDSEGVGGGAALEPPPVRLEALQDKTQLMCITVLLGLTYIENYLVKTAAVRALGIYVLFPCLREDVMFVADTANTILAALDDRSTNVRAKAAWSLGNLTDTLIVNMESVGVDFQEELSDMLLLKMLQAATRAAADKDRVKSNAVRALGNLLHFLRQSQMTRPAFQQPLEDAVRALVKTVQSEATMKVRWNACYALGNAFRNPALPLGKSAWSHEAFSALCHVVTSCKNFKVRIKSAAALAVPAHRGCYGDTERFTRVWCSLATALENSEDTNDFLEYRYSASLRHTLSQALLHLLSVSQSQDMLGLGTSLASEEGTGIREHLMKYLRAEEGGGEEAEKDIRGESLHPRERIGSVEQILIRIKGLKVEGEEERGKEMVSHFLEDLIKICEETWENTQTNREVTESKADHV
uniref:HEAT repeat-containing protein 6 n=1 Tax=Astatotilapia calliptera TaxID=8154 RepID=A0AAX7VHN0_ASTCA